MHVNGGALSGSSSALDTVLVEMPRSRAQRNAQADRYDGQTCCVSQTVGTQGRGGRGGAGRHVAALRSSWCVAQSMCDDFSVSDDCGS